MAGKQLTSMGDTKSRAGSTAGAAILRREIPVIGLMVVMVVLAIINALDHHSLVNDGIRPRSADGAWGILWAPLLHANGAHLYANAAGFLILGTLVAQVARTFWPVTLALWAFSGLGVWLISPANTVTVGVSGIIYGYAAYLIVRGFKLKQFGAVLVAVVVAVLYAGLIMGLAPTDNGVSWQAHLCGAIVGIILGIVYPAPHRDALPSKRPTPIAAASAASARATSSPATSSPAAPAPAPTIDIEAELEKLRREAGGPGR